MSRRIYLAVAACAVVVYLGALWNRFAFDDVTLIALNPLVHSPAGIWRAFGEPYWPGNLSGAMYRPLPVATFAIDWILGAPAWLHAVNVLWHAAVSVVVAALARRWSGDRAALFAGLLFAVHPVHVEAVANLVGRNELMAALFTLLAVYAAVARGSVVLTAAAMAGGLLSKENAAVAPALILGAWAAGLGPWPARQRLIAFGASWLAVGLAYAAVRWVVLHPYAGFSALAPQFLGQGPVAIRLTAVAALTDVVRLLLFPAHLQADYSPNERVTITTPFNAEFAAGLLCALLWIALIALAWRRGRRLEAYGLAFVGIAFLPVANLLFPHSVVVAERFLYLPSAGLAVALGAWAARLQPRHFTAATALIVLAGGIRSALRVPVWRDNRSATLALIEDAPNSYRTWDYVGWELLWANQPSRALEAFERSGKIYGADARVHVAAAHMAYDLGLRSRADSLLARADSACPHCPTMYRNQAGAARIRGDTAAARLLLEHANRVQTR
jgi:protein O-mannosyl-transferase